jgi:hypothetical protein
MFSGNSGGFPGHRGVTVRAYGDDEIELRRTPDPWHQPEHPHSTVHHVTINLDGRRFATAMQKSIVDSNTQVRGPSNYDGRSIPTPVDSGYQHNF